ncbi:PAM isoform 18 [Pan troglodytes]|uniref:PAM isoform 18 n=1 Tax=Pan troglodytes TaxID=9598 RepID=A0A2J8L7T5_PANTR|nr:PAM isoform 18 [Pan troglodytes]
MAGRVPSLLVLLVFPSSCLAFRSPLSVFKRFKETTRPFSNECLGTTRPVVPIDSSDFALDIRMPGVTPKQDPLDFCCHQLSYQKTKEFDKLPVHGHSMVISI